jgi:hypothetical protein
MEQQTMDRLKQVIKRHAEKQHTYYSGDEIEQIESAIRHYEREAANAVAEKLDMTDNTLTYFRAAVMLVESASMGATHTEKNARLRGLTDLLNHTIEKLKRQKTENLLNHSGYFSWDMATYPYQSVINKCNELERENKELKAAQGKSDQQPDEKPF